MDKNDFDYDVDYFKEEYGIDPDEILTDDEFDYSEIYDDEPAAPQDDDVASAAGRAPAQNMQDGIGDAGEDSTDAYPEQQSDDYDDFDDYDLLDNPDDFGDDAQTYDDEDAPQVGEEEQPPAKKKGGMKLPGLRSSDRAEKPRNKRQSADPAKKSAFSKFLDMYMEPVTKYRQEEPPADPLDPKYVRRRKREKKRIFKEVYLPAIVAGVALCLILSFIVGSVSNALTVKKNKDSVAQAQAQQQASAADAAEAEFKKLMAQVDALVTGYDYDGAISLLSNYSGSNENFRNQVVARQASLAQERDRLVELKDISTIPNLSFHVLMADASRACNKDVSGAELAGSYNKNFVSVEEFGRILNQLYSANYVLVDFGSFVSRGERVDGNESFEARSIFLPQGKKPVMLTETMVNYFEYMVDPDKDGKLDGSGHGFANKLVLDPNGNIKASYIDASGQTLVGDYDLVPVLESFIQEHPDFSYQGARAILAVTGTEGIFGYRTNTAYVSRFGQSFYDTEVEGAKKIVAALREKGYTLASYTYSNKAYRSMNTMQIQAEVTDWTNQITPILGQVDTIVFARASDIESYSGTTFNVLYNSGLRFFLNNGSSPRVDVNTTFVRQTRLMVTGETMAWYANQFASYFDSNVVLDVASRGSTPVKS